MRLGFFFFLIYSDTLCLLTGTFSLYTFSVIIGKYGFRAGAKMEEQYGSFFVSRIHEVQPDQH